MPKTTPSTLAGLVVLSCLVPAIPGYAVDPSAEAILKTLDELTVPTFDKVKMKDEAYALKWRTRRHTVWNQRQELILKLYKVDPDHPRIPRLMNERWLTMQARVDEQFRQIPLQDYDYIYKDIETILSHTNNPEIKRIGVFKKVFYKLMETRSADLAGIHEYFKLAPQDPRGDLLLTAAVNYAGDEAAQASLKDRIVKEFPDSRYAQTIQAIRHREESIGKPFDLEFIDAVTGSKISIKGLEAIPSNGVAKEKASDQHEFATTP